MARAYSRADEKRLRKGGKAGRRQARRRCRRNASDPCGRLIVGGIEAEWNSAQSRWRLHAHLVVIGATAALINNLRPAFLSSEERALKVQALRDPDRQLSYLVKFVTYFRPRRQTGPSRAVPPPRARFLELAAWRGRYRPRDFLFLFGARLGADDRIRPLPHTRPRAHAPTRSRTRGWLDAFSSKDVDCSVTGSKRANL